MQSSSAMNKAYLGDGCYVSFDGYALWLTTEDGISAQNTICLEPEVYHALTDYVARLQAVTKAEAEDPT